MQAFVDAGHDVLGVDLVRPVFDAGVIVPGRYQMAGLTDAGSAYAVTVVQTRSCMSQQPLLE